MRPCPQCGEQNPPHARFCLSCGGKLAVAAAPPEERKVVTVLFADVVGFTSLAERLDPEDVRALLTPFYALMRSVLFRYGGSIEQFMGDGVMAVFGTPAAHEDDPERAVRAALSLRESVVARNEQEPGFELDIRIGVNTGEVLISHDASGRLVAGDAVNTAQRLQTAAPVNGVLVGESTFQATQRWIEYRRVGAIEAKGKSEPVRAWEALAPFARFGPEVLRESPGTLVGRAVELALLEGMLARAIDTSESQLVTIIGAPGIGKSRLLAEIFLRGMRDRPGLVYWRQGRCPPYGERVAYSALADMVRAQAGILDTDSAERAGAKLRAALERLCDDSDWLERHLRPLAGLAEERSAERPGEAFAAWRRFFECLARERPVILVFEDLQWADDGLLDFVDQLVERLRELPLLVVCTARPELLDRRPDWGGGKRNSTTISLPRLTDEETRRLVSGLLEDVSVAAERIDALAARAEGNPLYAEEFVQMLRERGLLGLEHGLEDEAPLPLTVQGIIAARIDALPPEEKALLVDASVVGKLFWEGALDALADGPQPQRRELLRSLERRELIRRERSSTVAGEEEYAFRHVLVREVAYRLLPRSRRAEKHLRAAEWIEGLAQARADHAEARADHYLAALGYARDGAAIGDRARAALRDAGDRALALASPARAADFYEQALSLWPADDPERGRLLLAHGRACYRRDQGGLEAFAEAREALLAQGDREGAAEADAALALAHFGRGRRDEAFAVLERAAALLRDAPPSRAKVWVLSQLSAFLLLADRGAAALATGEQALAMAVELDDPELRARALRIVGAARATTGDAAGLEQLEQAIELALRLSSFEAVPALTNLAATYISFGDLPRAFDLQAQALELADRFADAMTTHWLTAERAPELYWRGRWDEALLIADELLAHRRDAYIDGILLVTRARIAVARGDAAAALADSERAERAARPAKDSQYLFPALACRARVLHETGRGGAAAIVDELLAALTGEEADAGSHWADLAAVLVALGRSDDLLAAAARVKAPTRWVDAVEAAGGGDFALAADTFAEIGSRPDEAWARLHAARAQRSEEQLGRALAFYRSVGAAAYVEAAAVA